MAKRKLTGQVSAVAESKPRKLTWREERFIEKYIKLGNGTQAALDAGYSAASARSIAAQNLTKRHIIEAVEVHREQMRRIAQFSREEAIAILVGMATARLSDFAPVLRNPEKRSNYVGLGVKEYALESAKKSFKNGNEIRIVSPSERRAAINDLLKMLGLDKSQDSGSWLDGLDEVFGAIGKIKGRSGTGPDQA